MTKKITVPAKLCAAVVSQADACFKKAEEAYVSKLKAASAEFAKQVSTAEGFRPHEYEKQVSIASRHFMADVANRHLFQPLESAVKECFGSLKQQMPEETDQKTITQLEHEFLDRFNGTVARHIDRMEHTCFHRESRSNYSVGAAAEDVRDFIIWFADRLPTWL